jgi:hypothetical protein
MAPLLVVLQKLLVGAVDKASLKLVVSMEEVTRGSVQAATTATTALAMAAMAMAACWREARGSS